MSLPIEPQQLHQLEAPDSVQLSRRPDAPHQSFEARQFDARQSEIRHPEARHPDGRYSDTRYPETRHSVGQSFDVRNQQQQYDLHPVLQPQKIKRPKDEQLDSFHISSSRHQLDGRQHQSQINKIASLEQELEKIYEEAHKQGEKAREKEKELRKMLTKKSDGISRVRYQTPLQTECYYTPIKDENANNYYRRSYLEQSTSPLIQLADTPDVLSPEPNEEKDIRMVNSCSCKTFVIFSCISFMNSPLRRRKRRRKLKNRKIMMHQRNLILKMN